MSAAAAAAASLGAHERACLLLHFLLLLLLLTPPSLANKYIDQHPDNLPGIVASFTRALGSRREATTLSLGQSAGMAGGSLGHRDLGTGVFAVASEAAVNEALEEALGGDTSDPARVRRQLVSVLESASAEAEAAAALRLELHRYSRMLLLTLALEVDRLEQLVRKHHPEYHYIDLEIL